MAAQAFHIQLTRKDYLRYFVRHYFFDLWTPWIVSLALAVVATWLLLGAFGAWWHGVLTFLGLFAGTLLGMLALSTVLFAFKLRGMEEGGIVLERKAVTIDDAGVGIQGAASTAHYAWSQIDGVRERGRFVFVKLGGAEMLLLWPRRDVPQGAVASIRNHLATGAAA